MIGAGTQRVDTYAEAKALNQANRARAAARRRRMAEQGMTATSLREGLRYVALGPDLQRPEVCSGLVERFWELLAGSILPSEVGPLPELMRALGEKNGATPLQTALGPHRYFALAAFASDGAMTGVCGFAVFCHRTGPATVHGSYYVVAPEYRSCGIGAGLLAGMADHAAAFVLGARPDAVQEGGILHFIEANDIGSMSLGERLLDEAIAMHPLDRDKMWESRGFAEIDGIGYHQRDQPPLPLQLKAQLVGFEAGAARFTRPEAVDAAVVLRHVAAFDSVLMDFERAVAAVAAGGVVRDPREEGLVRAGFWPCERTPLVSVTAAAENRAEWWAIDDEIRRRALVEALPLDWTMQACREYVTRTLAVIV